jgi:hypothetical protein
MYDAVDWTEMANEPSNFIKKNRKILEKVRNCHRLQKNSAP